MLLHEIVGTSGWRATQYLDRYVNHHQDYSQISSGDTRYDPQGDTPSFTAPTFIVPPEYATLHLTDPSPALLQSIQRDDGILFVAHPDMANDPGYLARTGLDRMPRADKEFLVAPTSSTRTLVTLGRTAGDVMIKTDYDARIDRVHRRVTEARVLHASRIGRALHEATRDPELANLGYLPESIGVTLRITDDDASVIYRETEVRPYVEEGRALVPYCSLYAHDMKHPDDKPLVVQLAEKHAKGRELDYFVDEVAGELIRVRSEAVGKYGLLLEVHGQNGFRELDENFQLRRVVYRDFQSTHVDVDMRTSQGLSVDYDRCVLSESKDSDFRREQHSYIYDHIIGDLLLGRLVATFTSYFPGYPEKLVISGIRSKFHEYTPDSIKELMPPQTYRVGEYGPNNKATMVVRHETPIFR